MLFKSKTAIKIIAEQQSQHYFSALSLRPTNATLRPKNQLKAKITQSHLQDCDCEATRGKKKQTLTVFPIDEKTRPGNFELHFSPTHNINDCFVVSCAIHCSLAPKAAANVVAQTLFYTRMLCRFLLLSRFCLSAAPTPPSKQSKIWSSKTLPTLEHSEV